MALGGADNLARSPELRTKLLWTLGLLCAYRIGVHIPVPGVDGGALAHFFESVAGTLFGLFDMFSGGGLRNVSVFALGIMPYISASIILQLLQVVSPELKRMAKEEGAAGRRKITQYTRYSTVLITIIQGFGIAVGLETMYSPGGVPVVLEPGWTFRIMTMLTLTAGTVLIMWLGEQITEKGIGNGISLIIFSGIVVGIPGALVKSFQLIKLGDMSLFIALALVILMVAVLIGVVFMERAQPVRQAPGWAEDVWRPVHALAAASEYGRGYPAHFRVELVAVPGYDGELRHRGLAENGGFVVYAFFHSV